MVKKLPKDLDIFSLSTAERHGSGNYQQRCSSTATTTWLGRRTIHKADVHPVTDKIALHGLLVAVACSGLGLDQLVVVMWMNQIPALPAISTGLAATVSGAPPLAHRVVQILQQAMSHRNGMQHAPATAMDIDDGTHE